MSRVGKKPIPLAKQVQVKIADQEVEVKGPRGQLVVEVPEGLTVLKKDNHLVAERKDDTWAARHGLFRSLLANAVTGVTTGFQKDLEIVGIGYRADLKGKSVVFTLGYSHPVEFPVPPGIQVTVERQVRLSVSGIDKQKVGQAAADIRSLRKPDPYKNKGIRYVGEVLRKKVGKTGATAK
ncbi:MAG: 50S ribosomal protein L6 [Acidobacteria bacterium]|nr:50S ribosomal protein L6 [Acidobacteriota bacterium]